LRKKELLKKQLFATSNKEQQKIQSEMDRHEGVAEYEHKKILAWEKERRREKAKADEVAKRISELVEFNQKLDAESLRENKEEREIIKDNKILEARGSGGGTGPFPSGGGTAPLSGNVVSGGGVNSSLGTQGILGGKPISIPAGKNQVTGSGGSSRSSGEGVSADAASSSSGNQDSSKMGKRSTPVSGPISADSPASSYGKVIPGPDENDHFSGSDYHSGVKMVHQRAAPSRMRSGKMVTPGNLPGVAGQTGSNGRSGIAGGGINAAGTPMGPHAQSSAGQKGQEGEKEPGNEDEMKQGLRESRQDGRSKSLDEKEKEEEEENEKKKANSSGIRLGIDWMYWAAIGLGLLKDIVDLVLTWIPGLGTIISIVVSIAIALLITVAGFMEGDGLGAGKVRKGMARRFMIMFGGTLSEMIPGLGVIPIETAVAVAIYIMVIRDRKAKSEGGGRDGDKKEDSEKSGSRRQRALSSLFRSKGSA
jgi:hypothetical protein